jgi:hypothetical protein
VWLACTSLNMMMAVYAQRSHNLVPSLRIAVRAVSCNASIWSANTCGVDCHEMLVWSCAKVIHTTIWSCCNLTHRSVQWMQLPRNSSSLSPLLLALGFSGGHSRSGDLSSSFELHNGSFAGCTHDKLFRCSGRGQTRCPERANVATMHRE